MEQFDFRNFTEQDLAEFSKEELLQMRGLLMKRKKYNQALVDESEQRKLEQETKQEVTTSNLEAAAKGLIQGASLGAADEVVSSLTAVKESIPAAMDAFDKQTMAGIDNVFSTYKQSYSKNMRDYNKHLKQLEKDHPGIYNTAELAGGVGTGLLTGGLVAKAGGGLVASLATMAGEGFIAGAASSNSETFGGRLEAGAVGGVIGAGAGAAGAGASKLAGKVANKMGESSFVNFFADSLKDFKGTISDDITEYATRMVNYTDNAGNPVLKIWQNAENALESITKNTFEVNKKLDNIYTSIDDLDVVKLDANVINKRLDREVTDIIAPFAEHEVGSSTKRTLQKKLQKRLQEDFTMPNPEQLKFRTEMAKKGLDIAQIMEMETALGITERLPKELNVSLLNTIKNDYFKEADKLIGAKGSTSGALSYGEQLKKVAFGLTDIIDEHIGKVSHKLGKGGVEKVSDASGEVIEEVEESLYDLWKGSSQQYHDLIRGKELLREKMQNNQGKTLFRKIFVDGAGKMTMAAGASMAMFGVPYAPAVVVGGALRTVAETPALTKAASITLNKIVTAMKKNPDAYADVAGRIMVASQVSSSAFYERVLEAGAEVDLKEQPIARNTQDVIARQDSIRTMIEMKSPDYLEKFEQALSKKDSAGLGSVISSIPGLKEYIAPGLGWEGKAVTKEDQDKVMKFMRKNLKPRQRRAAMLKFAEDLMIPEQMFSNQDAKQPENQVIYQKRTDKLRKDY